MVMTRVAGTPIDHREALIADGHDRACFKTAAEIFFTCTLTHGYFHGDQHGGNMMIDGQALSLSILVSWAVRSGGCGISRRT